MSRKNSGLAEKIPRGKEGVAKVIAAGAGFAMFGLIIDRGLGYVTRIVLARSMTPAEYGLLFLAFSVLHIAITFSVFSLNSATNRYVAYYNGKNDSARVRGVIISSLKSSVPFTIVAFIAMFFLADPISIYIFQDPALIPILRILSFALLVAPAAQILSAATTAFYTMKYDVYAQKIGKTVSTLAVLVVFLWFGFGLSGAAVAYLIGYVVMFFLILYFIQRSFPVLKTGVKSVEMKKKLFYYSWPLFISGLIWNFNGEMGTLLLGILRDSESVGIFQSALPNAQFLYILPAALMSLFIPVATTMLARGELSSIEKMGKTAFKWIFYLNFPFFIVLFFFPNAVINILFGSEYIAAGPVLSALAVALFICPINIPSYILQIYEKTKLVFLNTVISLIVNLVLSYILVPLDGPFGGAMGAAIAMVAMFVTLNVLCLVEAYKISRITFFNIKIWKSVLAAAISLLFIYAMQMIFPGMSILVMLIVLIAYFAIYSIALLVFGGLEKDDIIFLEMFEKKIKFKSNRLHKIAERFAS